VNIVTGMQIIVDIFTSHCYIEITSRESCTGELYPIWYSVKCSRLKPAKFIMALPQYIENQNVVKFNPRKISEPLSYTHAEIINMIYGIYQ